MAVNYSRVTQGSAQRGWTAGSIAPRATEPMRGPVANVGMSGNIPSNIMQAIGNLSAQQAFQQFLGSAPGQQQQPIIVAPAPDPAAMLRAQIEQAQQKAAESAAATAKYQLSRIMPQIGNFQTGFGGIAPMGTGAGRAALQQQQFGLENQLALANAAAWGVPRMSGWVGGAF